MKAQDPSRRRTFPLLLLLLIVVSYGVRGVLAVDAAGDRQGFWVHRIVDDAEDVGLYTSLVVDAQGRAHISYLDRTNGALKYAYQDEEGWQIEVADAGGDVAGYTSLALDAQGYPHISYYRAPNPAVKYAYRDAATWDRKIVDDDKADVGYTSLALDSSGRPHISYRGLQTFIKITQTLQYASWDGFGWQVDIVDAQGLVGIYNDLALGDDDRPRIAYGGRGLRYAAKADGAWQIDVMKQTGWYGYNISLALDDAGHPHLAYYNDWPEYSLKYAHRVTETWQIETVIPFGEYPSLALDAGGRPHISFYDARNQDLKYAHRDAEGWHFETVDAAGNVGQHSSIALDPSGSPQISYYDETRGALKHAYRLYASVWLHVPLVYSQATPTPTVTPFPTVTPGPSPTPTPTPAGPLPGLWVGTTAGEEYDVYFTVTADRQRVLTLTMGRHSTGPLPIVNAGFQYTSTIPGDYYTVTGTFVAQDRAEGRYCQGVDALHLTCYDWNAAPGGD